MQNKLVLHSPIALQSIYTFLCKNSNSRQELSVMHFHYLFICRAVFTDRHLWVGA